MPGYVFYRGPSMLDGAEIIGIAIASSSNRKTGNMVQTYIMRVDTNPVAALKSGDDSSVCGQCKHRPLTGGACYVNVGQGPLSVYRAYLRGRYQESLGAAIEACAGRAVRLGTYGDPAAIPSNIWQRLVSLSSGHTGYTHQWANANLPADHRSAIADLCMASVDSAAELGAARKLGLRTFRVRCASEPIAASEFACPASEEAGKRKTCAECLACDGSARGATKASPVIVVHGSKASRFASIAGR